MRISLCVAAVLFFSSCINYYTEQELYGEYAPMRYKNTYDTIELTSGNIYHRKVYNKNNKLVLKMSGKWIMESENRVQFYSFFFNLDRDVIQFPELLTDTVGGLSTYFETRKGIIGFCTGNYVDSNCYRKIR